MATVESKVIAITGGASGIGAATCRLLAQRGAAVLCVSDLSREGLNALKDSIAKINPATQVDCTVLNVTSSKEVEAWLADIIARHKTLDGAANVAGVAQAAGMCPAPHILGETDEEWEKVMKVNLDGVFYCTRAEVRAMKDLPRGKRSIVNVSSIASVRHDPDVLAYGTSKGAAAYFTTAVARDVYPLGIRVNTVSPGLTKTPLLPKFHPTLKTLDEIQEWYKKEGFNLHEPEDVARTIVWLLSDDSSPVHGTNINVGACMP